VGLSVVLTRPHGGAATVGVDSGIGLGSHACNEMRASLLVAACCYGAASAAGVGLNDDEIVTGAPVQRLDGLWSATNAATGMTIAGSVPGDLVTDLQRCVRPSGLTGRRAHPPAALAAHSDKLKFHASRCPLLCSPPRRRAGVIGDPLVSRRGVEALERGSCALRGYAAAAVEAGICLARAGGVTRGLERGNWAPGLATPQHRASHAPTA
jgi:hypothetical protein